MQDIRDVETLIACINMDECYCRRKVRGKDIGDWHLQLEAWKANRDTASALELLTEIIAAVETIEYDAREPQPYW